MKKLFAALVLFAVCPAYADCVFREDTASQTFLIGPFLDGTDGITAETGLTIANTDIRISKEGGNTAAKNSGGGTHDEAGMFQITLNATDTSTAGTLQIYTDSTVDGESIVPVFHECLVLAAEYYDLLDGTTALLTSEQTGLERDTTVDSVTSQSILVLDAGSSNNDAYNHMTVVIEGGTERGEGTICDYVGGTTTITLCEAMPFTVQSADTVRIRSGSSGRAVFANDTALGALNDFDPTSDTVDIGAISGDTTAADNAEAFFDGDGYAGTNNVIPTVTTLTGHTVQTGDSFARIGANGAGLTNIDLPNQTMDITGNLSGSVGSLSGHTVQTGDSFARIGAAGAGLTDLASAADLSTHDGKLDTADANIDLILADTNELQTDDIPSALSTHDGKLDTADANIDLVLADTNELQSDDYPARFTGVEGATFATGTDSLEAIRNQGDAAWTTGAGGSAPTVTEIRQEMDSNSTQLTAIVADTDELQSDDLPGLIAALNDPTAAAIAAAVMAETCEDQGGGLTVQECLSILLAEAAGTAVYTSGSRTWEVSDPSGTEQRFEIVYGTELDGDRTSSTLTPVTP